jgi:hypothetical protein
MARRPLVPAVALVTVLLAACGGSTAAKPSTVTLGKAFWFAGFKVTLDDASFTPQGLGGGGVAINATFENLGSNVASFDGTLVLTQGGSSYSTAADTQLPSVPGGTMGKGRITFQVPETFTFQDASLTSGIPDNQQAVVPLGATGEAVTLEPKAITVSGKATAGVLVVQVSGGEMRADVPENHLQVAKEHFALTLNFSVKNTSDFAGGYPFGYAGILSLRLPDGTTVAADDGPIELLSPRTTLPDQVVRFTINDPSAGTYALVVTDTEHENKKGEFSFDIA